MLSILRTGQHTHRTSACVRLFGPIFVNRVAVSIASQPAKTVSLQNSASTSFLIPPPLTLSACPCSLMGAERTWLIGTLMSVDASMRRQKPTDRPQRGIHSPPKVAENE